jgi:glycosyltransferase involved in cell wall biosynthesis
VHGGAVTGGPRVLIDATPVPVDRGGVGRYVDELVPALVRAGADVAAVVQERDREALGTAWAGAELVVAPRRVAGRGPRFVWEQTGLPATARRVGADVLHSVHYTAPLLHRGAASVITLHDATFFSHPDLHDRVKRVVFRSAIRRAVRRADALVVPSAATRDAVLRYAGGRTDQFHVAFHGVDLGLFHPVPESETRRVAGTLGLDDRGYIAFLGTLEPRKNVPALVRAWVRAFADQPGAPALVLAGGKGWDEDVDRAIAEVPAGLTVVRPGYLPLADLPGLLAGAQVVAYPSLGEGFGLPVLEAMACGAAVLTSRELSLPEVGGDAVAYAGTDVDSIARGLRELVGDADRRAALRAAALQRAASFTWDATARAHVAAYAAAVEAHRGG